MSIFKRGKTWWIRFTAPSGQRIRCSAGTEDKKHAQEYHDKLKASYWNVEKLDKKPERSWQEAVVRYLAESGHKASIKDDIYHLRRLDAHVGALMLNEVNSEVVQSFIQLRRTEGVTNATVNRTLAVLRAILRKSLNEWEWLEKIPYIKLLPEPKRRVRWLTYAQAQRLIDELPEHLALMVRFSLATGLRRGNVLGLEWSQVDISRRVCWIHPDQAKARKAINVPLNQEALAVLQEVSGNHPERVFTYKGKPIIQVTTKAWYKALSRSGISEFRWHDLRHTWASWHVQNGTPQSVLQELGGWESVEMVRRYAHLGQEHLADYADSMCQSWHKSGTSPK